VVHKLDGLERDRRRPLDMADSGSEHRIDKGDTNARAV
jgi:hypothetical protein